MNISRLRAEVAQLKFPPLTCKNQTTGEPYARFPDVQKEIEDSLSGEKRDGTIRDLKSETIVFFIRRCVERDEPDIVGKLVEELSRRMSRIIEDNAQGFDESTTDQIAFDVSTKIIELLISKAATPISEYLEISFRVKVRQLTLNQVEKTSNQVGKSAVRPRTQLVAAVADEDGASGEFSVATATFASNCIGPDDDAMRNELCDSIRQNLDLITDEKFREAVILRHLQGWPFKSKDPTKVCLCKKFGVSRPTINRWIEKAFGEMRLTIGDKHE